MCYALSTLCTTTALRYAQLVQIASPRKVDLWAKGQLMRVVACSGGGQDTMAIDEHGQMWGCGRNICGQLGLGNTLSSFSMTRIPFAHECALSAVCLATDALTHCPDTMPPIECVSPKACSPSICTEASNVI